MTLQEKEKHISGMGAPWAALAARAKTFCDESIARIPQTELSTNPKWDREFKAGVQKSYRDGYDSLLRKIIECADREKSK
jgi:hypothetical protein